MVSRKHHIYRKILLDHLLAAFTEMANSRLTDANMPCLFIQLFLKLQKPEDLATQMGCQPKYLGGNETEVTQPKSFSE
jgi:hypothetical protein